MSLASSRPRPPPAVWGLLLSFFFKLPDPGRISRQTSDPGTHSPTSHCVALPRTGRELRIGPSWTRPSSWTRALVPLYQQADTTVSGPALAETRLLLTPGRLISLWAASSDSACLWFSWPSAIIVLVHLRPRPRNSIRSLGTHGPRGARDGSDHGPLRGPAAEYGPWGHWGQYWQTDKTGTTGKTGKTGGPLDPGLA